MRIPVICLVALAAVLFAAPILAQKLPRSSPTAFKCEKDGKVAYSDVPCLGGERLEVKPTRGLNKMSGATRVGADVRAERLNEQMADALHPVFGETPEQRAKRLRRARLAPAAQRHCRALDSGIEDAEGLEKKTSGSARADVQVGLYRLRQQYSDLGC